MKQSLKQRVEKLEAKPWLRFLSLAVALGICWYLLGYLYLLFVGAFFGSAILGVYVGHAFGSRLVDFLGVQSEQVIERTKSGLSVFLFLYLPWIVGHFANKWLSYPVDLPGPWIILLGSLATTALLVLLTSKTK